MKNSPENILKKMYTDVKRSWFNDTPFRSATSISMTHVVPDAVIPLTGNTTVKLDLEQYLLSEGTPNPVYEGMRVDVALYFCPQRLYTRGIYGNNILEAQSLEQLPLPTRSYFREYNSYVGSQSSVFLNCRGSLLNRLGVPAFFSAPGVNLPLVKNHIPKDYYNMTLREAGSQNKSYPMPINMAVVSAYYDICRTYFANKFEDMVPIEGRSVWTDFDLDQYGNPYPTGSGDTISWQSLSVFGETINHVRGVLNTHDDSCPSLSSLFGTGPTLKFNTVYLLDEFSRGVDYSDIPVAQVVSLFENHISNTGLWPLRYDSHWQTMFFKPEDISGLENISIGNNVESYRLAEAKLATYLKQMLRGRTTEDWIDVQFGNKLKIADEPIFVGSDSFVVSFDQIVASAQTNSDGTQMGVRLGDTAGRARGGSQKAFDENGNSKSKTITFTTQEPGYLISLVRCTPPVSYSDVLPRYHEYDTLSDFPLPSYSGKGFQDLKGSDFVYTGLKALDDSVIGSQPYGFDHMSNYNRVSALLATQMKRGYTFTRQFDLSEETFTDLSVAGFTNYRRYLKSVYVEGDTFDNNFYDAGVNGRQNFTLLTAYNLRKCMPLEKQVTDYNL